MPGGMLHDSLHNMHIRGEIESNCNCVTLIFELKCQGFRFEYCRLLVLSIQFTVPKCRITDNNSIPITILVSISEYLADTRCSVENLIIHEKLLKDY